MNFIQTLTHICKTVIPSLTPKGGSNIAVSRNKDGFTIDCLLPDYPASCCVTVVNDTGRDLERGMTMKLKNLSEDSNGYNPEQEDLDAELAVFSLSFPSPDSDVATAYAVLMEDLKEGEEGYAAVSGAVAVQLSPGENGAYAAEPDGDGKLRPAADGPIPLPFPGGEGWGFAVIGGGGGGGNARKKGPFDVILKTVENEDEDEDGEITFRIVCRDTSLPEDAGKAGIVYLGSKHAEAPSAEFEPMEGIVFADVTADDDGVLSASIGFEAELPVIYSRDRRFILALARIYWHNEAWKIAMQRSPGNITITDRWA